MIQKIRMTCGSGSAGDCNYCMKELEKLVRELDEMRTNLKKVAREIIENI